MNPGSIRWHWLQVALVVGLTADYPMPSRTQRSDRPICRSTRSGPAATTLWRTPVSFRHALAGRAAAPGRDSRHRAPAEQDLSDSLVERRLVRRRTRGLAGKRIEFMGLQATITDVLVRVQMLDGTHSTTLVHPSQPWIDIATSQGPLAVAGAYLSHGIEHILFGFDHLLFVLGLILIVRSTRMLLLTVTGFTVAHSITLSLATLGVLHIPAPQSRLHRAQHPSSGE